MPDILLHPPLPAGATRPVSDNARLHWQLLLPKLAVVLLVVSLGTMLWMLQRNESEEQRRQLIADILWIEQNFRFELSHNEEQLQQLAVDMGTDAIPDTTFTNRTRVLMKNAPTLVQVRWLDAARHVRESLPSAGESRREADLLATSGMREAFEQARRLGKHAYSPAYVVTGSDSQFEILQPVYRKHQFVGMLVGTYSVDALLDHLVPWWFAEKYQLRVIDDIGTIFGSKSNIAAEDSEEIPQASLSYQVELEPPGNGLQLQAIAYNSPANTAQRLLAAVIIGLAVIVFWNLWALRSHIRRRQAAEEALRQANAFLKTMEDSMIVGMRARDLDGRITYVNAAFCRMVGYSAEELTNRYPPMPYWDPAHFESHRSQNAQVLAGEAPPEGLEASLRHRDGHVVHTRFYATPLIDANGRHTGWISAVLDITEQKRIEALQRQQQQQLEQTARLVTMGEMASTLAHELNQPLSAIASYNTGCLNLLRAGEAPSETLIPILEKLGQQAQRAGRIIRRVYDFVRKSEPRPAPCQLALIVDDSLGFIEAEAEKKGVRIEHHLPADLPAISADRLMLEQVLLNLLKNGIEAMNDTPPGQRELLLQVTIREAMMEVRIADRGHGIPQEIAEQLFTPFFTTKPEGMGMGLSICRSIIEFHHGQLWAEANPGGGTVFIFTLPLERNDAPQEGIAHPAI